MNPRNALALALMVSAAGIGPHLEDLLEAPKPRRPKLPNSERQAAAEAKRQRRAERNRKQERNQ